MNRTFLRDHYNTFNMLLYSLTAFVPPLIAVTMKIPEKRQQ